MPYIAKAHRKELDPHINRLAEIISERVQGDGFAGLLNYCCFTLALRTLKLMYGEVRYATHSLVCGVFHNITDEYYRRVVAPYEDKKAKQEGDVL